MKKRRINPLNLLFRCRWARMGLCVVFSAIVAIGAHAQTQNDGESGILPAEQGFMEGIRSVSDAVMRPL